MSEVLSKYTIIREFKNEYSIDEMMKRIISIHIKSYTYTYMNDKECSNHEVNANERK